ncbi:MAG: hypothetical protein WCK56_12620, partial [Alcaligenaceae bacterium]
LATAVGTALPILLADSYLLAADVQSDPGVFHAEGLAYLTDSGLPVDWASVGSQAQDSSVAEKSVLSQSYSPSNSHELDEYFDSAPVAHLGEPAAVASYLGSGGSAGQGQPSARSEPTSNGDAKKS